jgi:hypothetical protein
MQGQGQPKYKERFSLGRLEIGILPGGRGVQKLAKVSRNGLWPLPEKQLGHAPPPPRPFGRFGDIVAVDADRFCQGFEVPIRQSRRLESIHAETIGQGKTDERWESVQFHGFFNPGCESGCLSGRL